MTTVLDVPAKSTARPRLPPALLAAGVREAADLRVLCIFGTRPEAIKMAPVVRALSARPNVRALVCVTGQHRQMLDDALSVFDIVPDADLDVMRPGQSAPEVMAAIMQGLPSVFARLRPDCVLVHGDTTTTLAAALAAFYEGIPVGHVEAGLRTGDMARPWPEEMHRRCAAALARIHFAPTDAARQNLIAEGIAPGAVDVTGNTALDAIRLVSESHLARPGTARRIAHRFDWLDPDRKLILATIHRRETQGAEMADICRGIARLAARPDVQVVLPVHPNPKVRDVVRRVLGRTAHVHLVGPQDYADFVWLMQRATLIVTDSGGLQEEAPSLGKPVLVVRETTERPEAIRTGLVRIAGTKGARLYDMATDYLDAALPCRRGRGQAANPFGDGHAAERIAERLVREFVQ